MIVVFCFLIFRETRSIVDEGSSSTGFNLNEIIFWIQKAVALQFYIEDALKKDRSDYIFT